MKKIQNYINGELRAPESGNYLDNFNPSIGKVYSLIPHSSDVDIDHAYKAAAKAFPIWSKKTAKERSEIMLKVASLIDEKLESLAKAESLDNGKPFKLAKTVDIPRARDNFSFLLLPFCMMITLFMIWGRVVLITHYVNQLVW